MLGAGKMGSILLRAFLNQKLVAASHASLTVKHSERAAALGKELGVHAGTDNRAAVRGADVVLLALKPATMGEVLREISSEIKPGTLVVSVAASVPTSAIEQGGDHV